ncbi:MAG: hypothetical protein WCT22_04850 [Patescibacteria group bacterium]|jgi:hypothetical protein
MEKPTIRLIVDTSEKSRKAITVLENSGFRFNLVECVGDNLPSASLGDSNVLFDGLSGVRNLVEGLKLN